MIRCDTAGTYDLVTTNVDTPVGIVGGNNIPIQKLVTLDVGEGGEGPPDDLTANECTPLRPYYAADLRDPALKAAGVTAKYDELIAGGLCVQPRWGLPEDIGKAVAGLARGDFPFSTGQVVMVDGGLTIPRL